MMGSGQNRYLFTASQLQEFKHQALIYNYIVSGVPVPDDLLFALKRNLDSSAHLFLQKKRKCYKKISTTFFTESFSFVRFKSLKNDKQSKKMYT